jgi:hypothetical protein
LGPSSPARPAARDRRILGTVVAQNSVVCSTHEIPKTRWAEPCPRVKGRGAGRIRPECARARLDLSARVATIRQEVGHARSVSPSRVAYSWSNVVPRNCRRDRWPGVRRPPASDRDAGGQDDAVLRRSAANLQSPQSLGGVESPPPCRCRVTPCLSLPNGNSALLFDAGTGVCDPVSRHRCHLPGRNGLVHGRRLGQRRGGHGALQTPAGSMTRAASAFTTPRGVAPTFANLTRWRETCSAGRWRSRKHPCIGGRLTALPRWPPGRSTASTPSRGPAHTP